MLRERRENFQSKASNFHNNKYDYAQLVYINNHTKIKIVCPEHGIFLQTPHGHLNGGCKKCGVIFRSSNRASFTDNFIKKAIDIYQNKYDYSKFIYERSFLKGIIICSIHGEFLQSPNNHLCGAECPACFGTPKKNKEEFIKDAHIIHGNIYDYSDVDYEHNKKKVIIICPRHGKFSQKPNCHLDGDGCPKCNSSRGEVKIRLWLENNKVLYIIQKLFSDCRNPYTDQMLKFDFYIPDKNLLIEYDGEQHYNSNGYIGKHKLTAKDIKNIQYRDKIKIDYAIQQNIKLLRIKYTEYNNIDKILILELLKT